MNNIFKLILLYIALVIACMVVFYAAGIFVSFSFPSNWAATSHQSIRLFSLSVPFSALLFYLVLE